MADYAKGLPKKTELGELKKLKEGDFVDFVVQRHLAERAGAHYDVRLGTPETGLFSWATKKEWPKPKERIALFQQPLHRHEYKEFEGEIEEGYGKGQVKKHEEGRLLVTKITPKSLHFTKAHKKFPERFVLLKPSQFADRGWLLINTTPTKPIPYKKVHYSKVPPDKAEEVLEDLQPGSSVQAKIDGAASLTELMKDKFETTSYRISKTTGGPIVHTERLMKGQPITVSVPSKYVGTVLRGELYGMRKNKPVPPQELGGILNSALEKSVKTQESRDIDLKNMVFDIQQLGKKPTTDLPYEKRMELVREVLKHLPKTHFHSPEEARTSSESVKLFEKIRSGRHPLTREGIVIHPKEGKPSKVKFMEDHDVYITGIFPGEGKWKGKGGGGFTYALSSGGPTVGKVGTGFSDPLRRDIHENPDDYVGRVARIRAQEQHPSGAYRAPALISMHEDYPSAKLASAAQIALAYALHQ